MIDEDLVVASPAQSKAARLMLGWSQETLARRVGLSCEAIEEFEIGRQSLQPQSRQAIAMALWIAGIQLCAAIPSA